MKFKVKNVERKMPKDVYGWKYVVILTSKWLTTAGKYVSYKIVLYVIIITVFSMQKMYIAWYVSVTIQRYPICLDPLWRKKCQLVKPMKHHIFSYVEILARLIGE